MYFLFLALINIYQSNFVYIAFGQTDLDFEVHGTHDGGVKDRRFMPAVNIGNAVESTLKNHPVALIAKENREIARQDLRLAKSNLEPSASLNYDGITNSNARFAEFTRATLAQGYARVQIPVLNLSAHSALKAAQERFRAVAEFSRLENLKIASRSIMSYFKILELRMVLDLQHENYRYLHSLWQSVKDGALKQLAKVDDADLIQGFLGAAISDQYLFSQEELIAENNFERDSRMSSLDLFLIEPPALKIPPTSQKAFEIAQENNPTFKNLKLRIEAAKNDVKAAERAKLPTVVGQISGYNYHQYARPPNRFSQSSAEASLSVSIPLFNRSLNPAIEKEKAKQRIVDFTLQDELKNTEISLLNLYSQIKERQIRFRGLCEGLKAQMDTLTSRQAELFKTVSILDIFYLKSTLVKTASSLVGELLGDILDSYSIHSLMGTVFENLPAPTAQDEIPKDPNPQLTDSEVYYSLLDRCHQRWKTAPVVAQ